MDFDYLFGIFKLFLLPHLTYNKTFVIIVKFIMENPNIWLIWGYFHLSFCIWHKDVWMDRENIYYFEYIFFNSFDKNNSSDLVDKEFGKKIRNI